MNYDQVDARILEIKSVAGKNEKVQMLAESLQDEEFRDAIVMMLDPRIRFGIALKTWKTIKQNASDSGERSFADVDIITLNRLKTRQLTGSAAKEALVTCVSDLNEAGVRMYERILLKKPDAGFTSSSVNKAREGTVWTFDCMLAHKFEEKRVKEWPVATEPKIDGVRSLAVVDLENADVTFFSRSGKEYEAFDHMKHPLLSMFPANENGNGARGFVVDGEIDSGAFNETVSQARKKDAEAKDAVFRIFDILSFDNWEDGCKASYTTRRSILQSLFGSWMAPINPMFQIVESRLAHSVADIQQHNAEVTSEGGEGVIVKPLNHRYERKRSHSWMKIKGLETHDLIITGFFEGEGKYAGKLGGVYVDFTADGFDKPVQVSVGGGFSDADREIIWSNQSDYLGRMIEVAAHEQTPDGSLRHPRFVRWRDDKHQVAAE